MKHVLLIPNLNKDKELSVTAQVAELLVSNGAVCYMDGRYGGGINGVDLFFGDVPKEVELIVVIGGDGSLIDASTTAVERDIAIIGVNLGRMGYLAEVESYEIENLKKALSGEYKTEQKMLLEVECICGGQKKAFGRLAVNDVIISHDSFLGISEFSLTDVAGENVKYRADGLILSTPAGSTAYSLSAGGPIISHQVEAITATPICPHSFFNRSIIFSAEDVLKLKNTGDSPLKISIDGRYVAELSQGDECIVRASARRLKMITFSENNMFSTLFGKMKRFENI